VKNIEKTPTLRGKAPYLGRSLIIYGGGGGGGGASKRNILLGKCFADPTVKKSKQFFTQPQISIKKMHTHPWPKTLQKDTVQLSHMSFTTSVT
jgi:hypothetical protein